MIIQHVPGLLIATRLLAHRHMHHHPQRNPVDQKGTVPVHLDRRTLVQRRYRVGRAKERFQAFVAHQVRVRGWLVVGVQEPGWEYPGAGGVEGWDGCAVRFGLAEVDGCSDIYQS